MSDPPSDQTQPADVAPPFSAGRGEPARRRRLSGADGVATERHAPNPWLAMLTAGLPHAARHGRAVPQPLVRDARHHRPARVLGLRLADRRRRGALHALLQGRVPAARRRPVPRPGPHRQREPLRHLVQHPDGGDHRRDRGRDGVRRLPALAPRRASLRRLGPLPRRRGAHRDHRAQPLRRRRRAADRHLHPLPHRALVHGRGVRHRHGLRAQDHARWRCCRWCCCSPGRRAGGPGRWSPSAPRPSRRSCPTCSSRGPASGTCSSTTSSGRCRSRACWGRRSCSASCSARIGRRGPGATAPTRSSPPASASPPTCPAA